MTSSSLNGMLNGSRHTVAELYESRLFYFSDLPFSRLPLAKRLDFASFFGRWDYIKHHFSKQSSSMQDEIERVVSSAILGLASAGNMPNKNNHFMNQMSGLSNILLKYLPRSINTEMHASTLMLNNQMRDHSKWSILFVSVARLMSLLTMFWQYHEHLKDVIGLCEQIIKTIMKCNAGANINMLIKHELSIRIQNEEVPCFRMVVNETLLAFVKRRSDWDLDLIGDIEAFLCELGATDRRLFLGIGYEISRKDRLYGTTMGEVLRMTHNQSECLSQAYTHKRLRHDCDIIGEHLTGFGTEDTMPTDSNAQAEDILNLLLS